MTMPEPSRTGRGAGQPPDPFARLATQSKEGPLTVVDELPRRRMLPLRGVLDSLSVALIVAGMAVGDVAAWTAGGTVPGLATLGGELIALGIMLAA